MNSPVFDNVAKHTIFEGHRYRIIRHDGTVEDTEFKKLVAEISIDLKNYESTTVEDILRKIDECAVEMGKQQRQQFLCLGNIQVQPEASSDTSSRSNRTAFTQAAHGLIIQTREIFKLVFAEALSLSNLLDSLPEADRGSDGLP